MQRDACPSYYLSSGIPCSTGDHLCPSDCYPSPFCHPLFCFGSPPIAFSSLMVPPWSGFLQIGRELGCKGQPQASSDILHSGGVCLSPTSGLRDVIYADLIGVGLIGSSSSHMCWEGARESIKGSLHIMSVFLHLLSATPSPPLHFREPGHSGMRWEPFLGILTMRILLKPDKMVACA